MSASAAERLSQRITSGRSSNLWADWAELSQRSYGANMGPREWRAINAAYAHLARNTDLALRDDAREWHRQFPSEPAAPPVNIQRQMASQVHNSTAGLRYGGAGAVVGGVIGGVIGGVVGIPTGPGAAVTGWGGAAAGAAIGTAVVGGIGYVWGSITGANNTIESMTGADVLREWDND